MTGEPPSFTVVVPAYEAYASLEPTVRSVLAAADRLRVETGASTEVVVVDDGSTDDTPIVAAALARDDPRVRVIRQVNCGVSAARNAGARAARAPRLLFLDCDDDVSRRWLTTFNDATAGDVSLVCCGVEEVHEGGRRRTRQPVPLGPAFGDLVGDFQPGAFCIDRCTFLAVGGYAIGQAFGENYELGLRLAAAIASSDIERSTAVIAESLVRVRRPDRPGSSNAYSDRNRFESAVYVADTHGERLRRVDPAFLARYWAIAGVAAARLGRGGDARQCFVRAASLEPRNLRHVARVAVATVPAWRRRTWPPRP